MKAFEQTLKQLEADLKGCRTDDARLSHSLERAREVLHAERGFVLLADETNDELRVVASHGIDPETLWTTAEVSLSIIRYVLKEGNAVLSDNATDDPRFSETTSVVLSGLRSVLCVPIKSGRRTTALLYLDNRLQTGIFNQSHLDVMQRIALKVSARLSLPKPRLSQRNAAPAKRAQKRR